MKIGTLKLDNAIVFAPLAGITNLPLRLMAKEAGCGLVCSEMISANGLVRGSEKTRRLMDSTAAEKPLSVQIFGADPTVTAEAARIVTESGADVLDINFGCAVKKVVRTGSGVALMKTPGQAEQLLAAVRKAVDIPLTIKIRTGWDASGNQAVEIARIAEGCGVDAVAVHPRTASQGFGGCADWTVIGRVKAVVGIPVIGNGDVRTPEDARRMMASTGCDGVMVGRAAIGNPLLFARILGAMQGADPGPPGAERLVDLMERYAEDSVRYLGERQACLMMRSRLNWFVRGLPFAKHFRESVKQVASRSEILERIADYRSELERHGAFVSEPVE